MKFNFLYFFLYTLFIIFLASCSNDSLQKVGIIKKKINQFTVSRKAPLEMPPDMLLRPPKSKKVLDNNNSLGGEDEQLSLDDILNNTENKKKRVINSKSDRRSKEYRILKKILNTKATVLK